MEPLLARLLAAWRDTFDEALVEPIRRAGAEAARRRPGLRDLRVDTFCRKDMSP